MQLKSLQNLIPTFTTHTHSSQQCLSCTNPSNIFPPLQAKQVQLQFREIRQDDQLNKANVPVIHTSELHDTSHTGNAISQIIDEASSTRQQPLTLQDLISKYFPQ